MRTSRSEFGFGRCIFGMGLASGYWKASWGSGLEIIPFEERESESKVVLNRMFRKSIIHQCLIDL